MRPELFIADAPTLKERLSVDFDAQGRYALAVRGVFTVALSGGSVASQFFPELARLPFDWSRTEFFWADERAVPPGDPDSNYAVADALWLSPAHVPAGNIHRMHGEDPDLEKAVDDSPKPPPRRLTLTMPVLANAGRVVVVALGGAKAAAVRYALERDSTTPLAALTKRARNLRFLLDEEAASLLSNRVE